MLGITGCPSLESCKQEKTADNLAFERIKLHATYRLAGSADDYEAAADLKF